MSLARSAPPAPETGTRAALTTLQVLEHVAELQPVGVSALARASGIPKSSVQRCLATLRQAGWLTGAPTDRTLWVLTTKLRNLSLCGAVDLGLRDAAHSIMQQLQEETGETVHLSIYDGAQGSDPSEADHPARDELVIIDRLDSTQPVRTWVSLGTRVPLHASGSGRAVLAQLPEVDLERCLSGPLERFSPQTLASRDAVIDDLHGIRTRGYATVDGGWRPGVGAVAAALLDPRGHPVGALAISVPAQRYDDAREQRLGPLVADAAHQVTRIFRG